MYTALTEFASKHIKRNAKGKSLLVFLPSLMQVIFMKYEQE